MKGFFVSYRIDQAVQWSSYTPEQKFDQEQLNCLTTKSLHTLNYMI